MFTGTSTGNCESPVTKKPTAGRKERFESQYCYNFFLSGSLNDTVVTVFDGAKYDTREIDHDADLSMVADWNLPIFDMSRVCPVSVLSRVSNVIFWIYWKFS